MLLVYYYLIINIFAFIFYGIDKKKAEAGKWRISEAILILLAVLGGAFGAALGMLVFHHKTKKNKFRITVPLFVFINLLFICFCLYQNYKLVTTNYVFEDTSVPEELDGYKIVQISDLHNQFFGINQNILLNKIKEADPDMIAVTGDAVDLSHTNYSLTVSFFKGAVKIAPMYYITGNHELKLQGEKYDKYIQDIQALGVNFIDDQIIDKESYYIIGVADKSRFDDMTELQNNMSDNKLKIMLAHEPENIDNYKKSGANLIFCGHVHGGQIIIPDKGGVFSPGFTFFPKYYGGKYEEGNTTLIVSRGLGNSLLPVRINNYPEIVVTTLKHK